MLVLDWYHHFLKPLGYVYENLFIFNTGVQLFGDIFVYLTIWDPNTMQKPAYLGMIPLVSI